MAHIVQRFEHPSDALDTLGEIHKYADTWSGFSREQAGQNAHDLVRAEIAQGWPDGAKLLQGATRDLVANLPTNTRRKIERGHHSGFDPDVNALLNGRPDAWSRLGKRPALTAFRFMTDVSVSAGVGAEHLVWTGAVVCALCEIIDAAGQLSEVWVANHGYGRTARADITDLVKVKGADQGLLIDQLASVVASPRYYRTAMVGQDVRQNDSTGKMPGKITTEILERIAPDIANAVIVPRIFNLYDARAAFDRALDQITKGGAQ